MENASTETLAKANRDQNFLTVNQPWLQLVPGTTDQSPEVWRSVVIVTKTPAAEIEFDAQP